MKPQWGIDWGVGRNACILLKQPKIRPFFNPKAGFFFEIHVRVENLANRRNQLRAFTWYKNYKLKSHQKKTPPQKPFFSPTWR